MNTLPVSLTLVLVLGTALATFLGGTVALRLKPALQGFFAFSSGVVVGVSLFDLLPESLDLSEPLRAPLAITPWIACGFVFYLALDSAAAVLFGGYMRRNGHLGPGVLTLHSLIDGLALGVAFAVSNAVGLLVAFAVLAHDFLDGANTVALSLAGGGSERTARRWLAADAVAPAIGLGITQLLGVPAGALSTLLAICAGAFLYIGASELLPRSLSDGGPFARPAATALGLALIYVLTRWAAS